MRFTIGVVAVVLLAPSATTAQTSVLLAPPAFRQDSTLAMTSMQQSPSKVLRAHRTLGTVALGTFGTALVIGAASGNLGKLTDASACCPDGGTRDETWRTVDRVLVNVGILSYLGAGGLGIQQARRRSDATPSARRRAHRRLAMAHGAVFATSLVTGIMMGGAQETDADKFARVARIHVAANVALVPLLAAAFTSVTVRD